MVDCAPNRGYNEITVKENTKQLLETGQGGNTMNTYKITFQRENGTIGSDCFTAATEAQARRDFKEVYRHGNGTITNVELVSEDAPATKEQERKALDKIRKIVEEIGGADSYIGMAFEGCFEIAEENIENDFACSMKQRVEKAKKYAENFKRAAENFSAEADRLREENEKLKGKVLTTAEAGAIKAILHHAKLEAATVADRSAEKIVELADSPESAEFRQAVQDNRASKKRLTECDTLIQRLLETMA